MLSYKFNEKETKNKTNKERYLSNSSIIGKNEMTKKQTDKCIECGRLLLEHEVNICDKCIAEDE